MEYMIDFLRKTTSLESDNCNAIFGCNWVENPEKSGIPVELMVKVYNDHKGLKVEKNSESRNRLRVTYVQEQENDTELQNLLRIVSLFNQLNSIEPFIFCNQEYAEILNSFSNEHICFISQFAEGIPDTISTDVVITYGSGVLHFLKSQIPVVIIGPYGLGGWVTSVNFPYLLKSGFRGRAGSTSEEYIPPEIFAHELLSVKDCKDIDDVLVGNKGLADALPYPPLSDIDKIRAGHSAQMKKLNDQQARWKLKPRMASNIMFESIDEAIIIKRRHIYDTLCTIDKEDLPFFRAINGETTCRQLYKDAEMNEEDFWEMMHSLHEKKIILF